MDVVNKRAWLRIVEASIAVLMILSGFLLMPKSLNTEKTEIQDNLFPLLEEMAKNESIRTSILSYDIAKRSNEGENAIIWNNLDLFLSERIKDKKIKHFVSICGMLESCSAPEEKKDVYSYERIITANIASNELNPRKIKLYLWRE